MESVVQDGRAVHPDLQELNVRLQQIHEAISNFQPLTDRPPILDSSLDVSADAGEDSQWLQQEHIPGLKNLRDSIKIDLDVLQKFLDDPESIHLPPLSTNAPYLIAVWNEVLCAPAPIVSVFKTFLFQPISQPSNSARKRGAQRPPGAKVDVVADNGRRWIRVNTVKNSRILSEFREIDSYLTDSEDDSDDEWEKGRPTLAQTDFDNSILRMGRSLLQAAKANPIEGTSEIPKVTLRLTRLDPEAGADSRIGQTIQCLLELGVDVELGERGENDLPTLTPYRTASPSPPLPLEPTPRINLDLSVLIAVISDLTHAELPSTIDEANRRFIPPQEYCEWKQKRQTINGMAKGKPRHIEPNPATDEDATPVQHDLAKHSRALTNQLLQEMGKGLLQEIHDKILAMTSQKVEFWTTPEARERCLRIVSKIGGPNEKRRAFSLFSLPLPGSSSPNGALTLQQAEVQYWQSSRYPLRFIPLLPIHLYPTSANPDRAALLTTFSPSETNLHLKFHKSLGKTCEDILAQETIPHPRALPEDLVNTADGSGSAEIQRAIVTKANPRLTAHTVQSMLWGANLGWTTLTANRMSVKAILREMKIARVAGRLDAVDGGGGGGGEIVKSPAIWVVDPRSLAEGMSSQASFARSDT